MKLLLTSFGVLLFSATVYMALRLWGSEQRYQSYDHSFLTDFGSGDAATLGPALSVKIQGSENEARQAREFATDIIFYLDVRMSKDEILFAQAKGLLEPLLKLEKLGPERYQGDRPYFYPFDNLKIYFPELTEVSTLLQRFQHQRFILNLQDNAQNIDVALVKLIKETNSAARVLIQSDIDVVIKSIRQVEPTWFYGSSLPEITRILSFESLGLEMVPSIRADVWLSPLKFKQRPIYNEALGREVHRRFKKVFLGPLSSPEEILDAQRYNPDGLIFSDISSLKEYFKKK